MPYLEVNGARIFFRRYGERAAGPPVFLIHGATVDGATDWAALAPALGLHHEVIVPDCRGHGRSTNPTGTYRFAQLADDIAAMIRALAHETAHVVGHSNGGNVALVTLVEHPEVIATCVVQAANAYVSADLIEKEPANFAPEGVARDYPEWRDQMIRLHGRWHGRDYWRELLAMTVAEIVAEPNYRPSDLARVDRPTLVVEGQNDRVNGASRHGEFTAGHIPDAELWRPAGAGHSVHEEQPGEWLIKVEDFWRRRGTPVRDRLWRFGRQATADPRTTVFAFDVTTEAGREAARVTVLDHDSARRVEDSVSGTKAMIETRVLAETRTSAVIVAGVADVVEAPAPGSQRLTQALFGESVAILDMHGNFSRVRLERDGYVGWINAGASQTTLLDLEEASHRIWSDEAIAHASPGGEVVGRLPFGARLRLAVDKGSWLGFHAARGTLWWVPRADTRPIDEAAPIGAALARFRGFIGVPYLWGGRTPWGFDCSGLAQALLAEVAMSIPRDADQQWRLGRPIEGDPEPGDLLFFGDQAAEDPDRVAHVGIALGEGVLLHAWGASAAVSVTTLRGRDRGSVDRLRRAYLGARRYLPGQGPA